MDDEIDIEEHDILEHPQVKATFPDLSRIKIEVHASGASFFDNAIDLCEEQSNENLLKERHNYTENGQDYAEAMQDDEVQSYTEDDQDCTEARQEHTVQSFTEDGQYTEEERCTEVIQNEVITEQDLTEVALDIRNNLQECEDFEKENLYLSEVIEIPDDEEPQVPYDVSKPQIFKDTNQIKRLRITGNEVESQMITDSKDECLEIMDNELIELDTSEAILDKDLPELDDFDEEDINKPEEILDELYESNIGDEIDQNNGVVNTDMGEKTLELTENNKDVDPDEINENFEEIPEFIENDDDSIDNFERLTESDENTQYSESNQCYEAAIKKEFDDRYEFSDFNDTVPSEIFSDEEFPPEDIFLFKNKIILGSKPSPILDISCQKLLTPDLLLEDWGPRLENNQSFCKDCLRLFTTPNALDAHKMTTHSLLTPIMNRAVKSTAKSPNIARKSTTNRHTARKSTSVASNSTYCNHCNVTFKDHTSLITHLYELLPSKEYFCTFCDAKFINQNDLVNHNATHVKMERKVLKPKANPILKNLLRQKDTVPMVKNETPVVVNKDLPESTYVFKCVLCSEILDTYGQARFHRRNVHPETAKKMLFKRMHKKINAKNKLVFEKTKVSNAKVKKINEKDMNVNVADNYDLIPKSALFKCADCNVHFLSCYAGVAHCSHDCRSKASIINYKYRIWQCPICKKKLRKTDKEHHEKQHELSSKFKIYVITKTVYERTLCKCPKCNVHFDFLCFKPHLAKCGKLATVKCQKCNILIRKIKLAEHESKHRLRKLNPKDFIIIDYAVLKKSEETEATVKIPIDSKTSTSAFKNKILVGKTQPKAIHIKTEPGTEKTKLINRLKFETDKINMYYCRNCKNYLAYLSKANVERSMIFHLSKKCRDRGQICTQCGLRVQPFKAGKEAHEKIHQERNITLNDYRFIDMKTKRHIIPQIPKYFSCKTCNIHFLDFKYLSDHICGEDYENCDVCGDKYEMTALALHRPFHDLQNRKAQSQKAPEPSNRIPELIMKYESLNAIWNILFVCGKCELVTDVYNQAVEHSQAHLNSKHNTKTIKCYICNLKFDESCWPKHSELHSRMTLNNKDFKILKYEPKNLLEESWFQMFDSLPENEIRQIIDRSVFGSERGVKMELVKDGLPEFTLHCCSECEVAFDSNDIRSHVKSPCKLSAHICIKCNIAFGKSDSLAFHELLHERGIKTNEFRVVNFVKETDVATKKEKIPKEIKKKVKVTKTKVQKETKSSVQKVQNPNAKYTLHRCKQCTACLHMPVRIPRHICGPRNVATCEYCHQNFNPRIIKTHEEKHKKNREYTLDNIKVVEFQPVFKSKKNKPNVRVEQIKERKTLNSSKHKLNWSTDIEEVEKPKRKTANSSKSDISVQSDTSVESIKRTAKVYKCDCGLHYTSLKSVEKHIETCGKFDRISKENCSKCGLLFPTDILVSHLCKHHSNLRTNIQVEEVHKETRTPPTPTHTKLYKCGGCNVYFLNQNSCYKHTLKHVTLDPKEYIECKMCTLQFKILSLHIHIKKHHKKEFNLEKVLVEEYQPSRGKGAPKIDIYFASDRCQSVLVSSSND